MSTENLDLSGDSFEMSDEEFLNTPASAFETAPAEQEQEEEEQEEVLEEVEEETTEEEEQEEVEADLEEPSALEDQEVTEPEPVKEGEQTTTTEPDYKAAYEELFKPFKANGREMKVESVQEAVTLMQMGANYNKKMSALKPNLKLLKLLENNNLLSEEKIGFLIDLDKKDPGAISKLLKDGNIDPLDVDVDKAQEYAPKTYTVEDQQLALDEVLDTIQETPTFKKLITVVSNKWDANSKQVIAEAPQLLRVINDHMASGVYDVISNEIERERMFGRLEGLTDLQAYQKVGDALQAKGRFDHLFTGAPDTPAKVVVQPPVAQESKELRDKRKAAATPRASAPAKTKVDYNPLDMSDDEFLKLSDKFN